ncbi:MAG: YeeE/YedE thiosulfate transporter family protein [Bacteroidia bacterium]|nr:YeeE/YedE thiosulfate transporter family protein [Bacteroidia bacterium]
MKSIKAIFIGILFGIILIKSEAVSWFRIQEMFHFESFHMYGIIGSAVVTGIISLMVIKKWSLRSFTGEGIKSQPQPLRKYANLFGGILFGFGWALLGACPGPLYGLLGFGYSIIIIPILLAILGVVCYGLVKDKLPH